jgi:hypothetical protein
MASTRVISWCESTSPANARSWPEAVSTRIGTLEFENGRPTAETAKLLHEARLFQAAVQIYMWSHPIVAVAALRDSQRGAGIRNGGIPITETFLQPDTIVPTGNQETIYAYSVLTLKEPMVLEAVPGVLGFAADAWQRPIEDIGLTGPDQGEGGKYLLLPPDYEGDVPEEEYFVYHAPTFNVF